MNILRRRSFSKLLPPVLLSNRLSSKSTKDDLEEFPEEEPVTVTLRRQSSEYKARARRPGTIILDENTIDEGESTLKASSPKWETSRGPDSEEFMDFMRKCNINSEDVIVSMFVGNIFRVFLFFFLLCVC